MDILQTVERRLGEVAEPFSIGASECGNPILCAHVGALTGMQLIVTAAIHARECYTALVVLRQAAELKKSAVAAGALGGGTYFIPLVNPDGALFFETGETFGRKFLRDNSAKRREWKANADGVDLNTDFDANWGTGKHNVFTAGASDYVGKAPMSAAEVRALAGFTERIRPTATISYHCMGGELYWEFFQKGAARRRDLEIATALSNHIGVKRVDGDLGSAGGYKDYCIQRLGIPSFTIELIKSGSHPFMPGAYAADVEANADVPEFMLNTLQGIFG